MIETQVDKRTNPNIIQLEIPQAEIEAICQRYQMRQLALFGSTLWDDFGPKSDVDVLVDFEPKAEIGFMALSGLQIELSELFNRPVDLVPRNGLKAVIMSKP